MGIKNCNTVQGENLGRVDTNIGKRATQIFFSAEKWAYLTSNTTLELGNDATVLKMFGAIKLHDQYL